LHRYSLPCTQWPTGRVRVLLEPQSPWWYWVSVKSRRTTVDYRFLPAMRPQVASQGQPWLPSLARYWFRVDIDQGGVARIGAVEQMDTIVGPRAIWWCHE